MPGLVRLAELWTAQTGDPATYFSVECPLRPLKTKAKKLIERMPARYVVNCHHCASFTPCVKPLIISVTSNTAKTPRTPGSKGRKAATGSSTKKGQAAGPVTEDEVAESIEHSARASKRARYHQAVSDFFDEVDQHPACKPKSEMHDSFGGYHAAFTGSSPRSITVGLEGIKREANGFKNSMHQAAAQAAAEEDSSDDLLYIGRSGGGKKKQRVMAEAEEDEGEDLLQP